MSKNLKIFLGVSYLLILFFFLYFIFKAIEINRLDDFLYYKEIQSNLETYISNNILINVIYFFAFSIIWVTLLGFGSPILIISGILFGKIIGTLISLFSISIGALILYSIGNFFFRDLVKSILEKKFNKYIQLFQKNEFFYFFIYRFIGGLGVPFRITKFNPNFIWNEKNKLFFASFFGFIPGFFIINTIGAGLNNYISQADSFSMIDLIFTPEIYLPIIMFSILMFFSIIIKKKFFDDTN